MISFKHKFVFIKTKKVAGTSVEALLRSILGESDVVTRITFRDEKFCADNSWFPRNWTVQKVWIKRFYR
ncbi:hypothetical protein [Francisella sciaenopsi]